MRLIITVEDDKPSTAASVTSLDSAPTDGAISAGAAPDSPSTAEPTFSDESGTIPGQKAEDFDVSTATSAGAAPDALASPDAMFFGDSPWVAEQSHENADTSAGPGVFVD